MGMAQGARLSPPDARGAALSTSMSRMARPTNDKSRARKPGLRGEARRYSKLPREELDKIDYKNVSLLQRFITERGKIRSPPRDRAQPSRPDAAWRAPSSAPASWACCRTSMPPRASSAAGGRGGRGRDCDYTGPQQTRIILISMPGMISGRAPTSLAAPSSSLAALAGCGEEGAGNPDAEVQAVATTTQLGDFARQVGGERVAVEQILEPNADPHSYEPRPSDAAAIAEADLVLRSGGDVDEWLGELIDNAGGDAPVIELIDSIDPPRRRGRGRRGPALVAGPRNAEEAVAAIRDGLIDADPEGRRPIERNATPYIERLRRLDSGVARCIDRIPRRDRKLVTTHDALGYYADRYGLEVIGALIPSLSTQAQPSSKDIARAGRPDRRAGSEGDLSRELGQSQARGGGGARNRRRGGGGACGPTPSGRGLERRHLHRLHRVQHRGDRGRAHRWRRALPPRRTSRRQAGRRCTPHTCRAASRRARPPRSRSCPPAG